jgi:glucose-6-phosphate isomerase
MSEINQSLANFKAQYSEYPSIGLALDLSKMRFTADQLSALTPRLQSAFEAMAKLEAGAIANPDEKRMVGHYWLRNPALAPNAEIRAQIEEAQASVISFAKQVHTGEITGVKGRFKNVLLVGIGGSALGPQFVAQALGKNRDKMSMFFLDNTDPDGIDRVLGKLSRKLGQTLCIVISKSGGTKETRNGMVEAEKAWAAAGLDFTKHAVAVTSNGSELHKHAATWLKTFPMWDWVGGRTSELSPVGMLPAALQGIDIQKVIDGAKAADEITRIADYQKNPAAQIAAMIYLTGNAKGDKHLIVLPYKDRLELFSKYLQQLIMESLGKSLDLDGNVVNQGLTVLGNKGSTDQHAYVQQLRDGRNDFFVTFIEVLKDRDGDSMEVEPGVTSGDFLSGFYQGTRKALYDAGRDSLTITVNDVSPFSVGVLIALFERIVGLYASLININAYHQPGVEAGKKAATEVLKVQAKVFAYLQSNANGGTAEQIACGIGTPEDAETVFKICTRLAKNRGRAVSVKKGASPLDARFLLKPSPTVPGQPA